jgi:hypothetical protein
VCCGVHLYTSSFGKHGLLTVVSVLSTILGGSSKLTLAKIIDVWGRVEGFLIIHEGHEIEPALVACQFLLCYPGRELPIEIHRLTE